MKNILFAGVLLLASNSYAGSVSIEGAYVRHMPPTQPNTAAFMLLTNSSDADRALISVESDVADKVELHTHMHDNGVMRMRQVEKIDISAHKQTELQPGGFHIMLIGLKQPLSLGQMVDIKANFDDGSSESIQAEVKSVMAGMNMQGGMMKQEMDHGKMDHSKMKNMTN